MARASQRAESSGATHRRFARHKASRLWLACRFLRFRRAEKISSIRSRLCDESSCGPAMSSGSSSSPGTTYCRRFSSAFQGRLDDFPGGCDVCFSSQPGTPARSKNSVRVTPGHKSHNRDTAAASFRPQRFTEMKDVGFTGSIGGHESHGLKRRLRRHIDDRPVAL
jgi:hypothetical protein